jgi:hypothetical protein
MSILIGYTADIQRPGFSGAWLLEATRQEFKPANPFAVPIIIAMGLQDGVDTIYRMARGASCWVPRIRATLARRRRQSPLQPIASPVRKIVVTAASEIGGPSQHP